MDGEGEGKREGGGKHMYDIVRTQYMYTMYLHS